MKLIIVPALLLLLMAACQPTAPAAEELPTQAVLPSVTATEAATETAEPTTVPATATPEPSATAEATTTAVATNTPVPSRTSPPVTATYTTEPTQAAIGTATQAVLEAPRFSTFTPAPAGGQQAGAPQQLADVVINEVQFQEEVSIRKLAYPNLESATVDFVPGGIRVRLTAYDGVQLTSGMVLVAIVMNGNVAAITISEITADAPAVPQGYIDVATGDFFVMMVETLDTILKQRLGPEQDLQNIVVTDSEMQISLVVPQ